MSVESTTDLSPRRPESRPAAVLLLVRPVGPQAEPHLVLIRRSQKVHTHKGQISFPGGGFHPSDGQLEVTALRETQEELGLAPASLRVLGALTPVDTVVSNFMINPFLAVPHDPQAPISYVPDDFEVASVLEVPLKELLKPSARRDEEWVMSGQPRQVVFYNYGPLVIWGATAYILSNFFKEIQAGKWASLFE